QGPPPWLGPRLQNVWQPSPPLPISEGQSHTQEFTWRWLTQSDTCIGIEEHQTEASFHGFEHRYPFLDVRLANFVLGLPPWKRQPRGRMKAILRDGLHEILPRR